MQNANFQIICSRILFPHLTYLRVKDMLQHSRAATCTDEWPLERHWLSAKPRNIFLGLCGVLNVTAVNGSHVHAIVKTIARWALYGFPNRIILYRELSSLLFLLYSWLLQQKKHIRTNLGLWQIAYIIQHSLGLFNFCFRHCRSARFRLSSRMSNPAIHEVIVYKKFDSIEWTSYIYAVTRGILFPHFWRDHLGLLHCINAVQDLVLRCCQAPET